MIRKRKLALSAARLGGERSDRIRDRTAGPALRWRDRRTLFKRSDNWRVFPSHSQRNESVLLAHRLNQPLLPAAQDLHRQRRKIAKYPHQMSTLYEGRIQITGAERSLHPQHAPEKFGKLHANFVPGNIQPSNAEGCEFQKRRHYCIICNALGSLFSTFSRESCPGRL